MSSKSKILIYLIPLMVFAFSLMVFKTDKEVSAQTVVSGTAMLSASSGIAEPGQGVEIKATLTKEAYSDTVKAITFSASGGTSSFSPPSCTILPTGSNRYCIVTFTPSTEGAFTINASVLDSGRPPAAPPPYTVTPVRITVQNSIVINPPVNNTNTVYKPLAPLPDGSSDDGYLREIDTKVECAFGKYLNILIKLLTAIAAILAMIMIAAGGIERMTSELVSSKESGNKRIWDAVVGLLVVLGGYLMLNTVNPDVLEACLKMPTLKINIVDAPDAGDSIIDPDFVKGIASYIFDNNILPSIASAITKVQNDNWELYEIHVYQNNTMLLRLRKGSQTDDTHIVNIAPGKNGYAPPGTAVVGDGKTPVGNWKIIDVRYSPGKVQFNKQGSNMGAAFWHLNPMVTGERGIGIHGNKSNTLTPTNGCIRLRNSDILALQPYIKVGLPVIIH